MATLLPSSNPCVPHPNSRPCPEDVGAQGATGSQLSLEITLPELGGRPWALLLKPDSDWPWLDCEDFPTRVFITKRETAIGGVLLCLHIKDCSRKFELKDELKETQPCCLSSTMGPLSHAAFLPTPPSFRKEIKAQSNRRFFANGILFFF